MRGLRVVFLKEILENIRDRRTLWSALLFAPLFGPLMFAGMISLILNKSVKESDEALTLPVAGASNAPHLVGFLESMHVTVQRVDYDDQSARRAIRDGKERLILIIPANYGERLTSAVPAPVYLYADGSNSNNSKYSNQARQTLGAYGRIIAVTRLQIRGINPAVVSPIVVQDIDVSTPAGRALLVLGMMTYFVMFAMLMGGLYLTIDATAGERERGSLEALLTTPIGRDVLIYGKILAACFYMLVSLAISLAAFSICLRFVPLEQLGMTTNFGPLVAFKMLLVAAPFVLLGASLMTVVASFTRSYREAQSWLTFVLLVPTMPVVFAGLLSVRPSLKLMALPSMSQHLLMTSLLRDESLPLNYLLVSVVSTLLFGVILAWIAGRLYRREAILG
jgi:sodium transport system permease protein